MAALDDYFGKGLGVDSSNRTDKERIDIFLKSHQLNLAKPELLGNGQFGHVFSVKRSPLFVRQDPENQEDDAKVVCQSSDSLRPEVS